MDSGRFFVGWFFVLSALMFSLCVLADESQAEQGVRLEKADGAVDVMIDGALFTRLVHSETPRPYLYPIIGPTGAAMTRSYPMVEGVEGEERDHPHHQSLWFAHGAINGVDYWTQGKGRGRTVVQSSERGAVKIDGASVSFIADLVSDSDAGPIDHGDLHTKITFGVTGNHTRTIDYEVVYTCADREGGLLFGDTKEGTMAIRMNPALRLKGDVATGHCVNSEGDTDFDCWGKRAKWVAYWGEVDGKIVGVALFDSPSNLRHPCWWHARDYGLVAANPFGAHDFEKAPPGTGDYTLERGQKLALSYRFVFFEGDAKQADIASKYEQWAAGFSESGR